MPAHYDDHQIRKIAAAAHHQIPLHCVTAALANYEWPAGVYHARAAADRARLERSLCAAVATGGADAILDAADEVHQWGFGSPMPAVLRQSEAARAAFLNALQEFAMPNRSWEQLAAAAQPLLDVKGIGIAKASKWFCFVDQKRYAIYDSRVSVALRHINVGDNRAFPIVGRRVTAQRLAWPATAQVTSTPLRMARAYVDYLRVLHEYCVLTRPAAAISASQIEMALFMLGDIGYEGEELPPLPPRMWMD